tara:strand:- start:358 stop:525 length:168 start_codon:yes stop_codon:yes gene_type:complete
MKINRLKRGEIGFDTLIPWLIGLGVLVLMGALFFIISGKGGSAWEAFKNVWRFGR